MTHSDRDRLLDMLGALPAANPASASAERLRARCHAALTRAPRTKPGRLKTLGINGLMLSAWLLYLAAAFDEAVKFLALRP